MKTDPKESMAAGDYYPHNVGRAIPGTSTQYAFLVTGKENKRTQMRVLDVFFGHGAKIISQTGYLEEKTDQFTLCLSCDLRDADFAPDDFLIQVRKTKHVADATMISMRNKLFDGLLFPLVMMDSARSVALNSRVLFEIQDRLQSPEGNMALLEIGRAYALDIASQIKAKLGPDASLGSMQENLRGYLRAAGFGTFTWHSEERLERVMIVDPPTSQYGEGNGNYFVQGLAVGLVESFLNRRLSIFQDSYDPETRCLTLALAKNLDFKPLENLKRLPHSVEDRQFSQHEEVAIPQTIINSESNVGDEMVLSNNLKALNGVEKAFQKEKVDSSPLDELTPGDLI